MHYRYALGDAWNNEYRAQFNIAENAAAATDMPFMAVKLLQRMRLDPRVNMSKHWKLLTLMIGTNDFCSDICHQNLGPLWMNREIEGNIIKTLRIIRDGMPRYFIGRWQFFIYQFVQREEHFWCFCFVLFQDIGKFGDSSDGKFGIINGKASEFANVL